MSFLKYSRPKQQLTWTITLTILVIFKEKKDKRQIWLNIYVWFLVENSAQYTKESLKQTQKTLKKQFIIILDIYLYSVACGSTKYTMSKDNTY